MSGGGLDSSVPGWSSYWENQFNLLDPRDKEGEAVGRLASLVVGGFLLTRPPSCGGQGEAVVEEVTTLVD